MNDTINAQASNPARYSPSGFHRLYHWLVFTSILAWLLTLGFIPVVFILMIATIPESTGSGTPPPFPIVLFLSLMAAQLIVLAAVAGAIVVQSILLHRAWSQIQDGNARTTPQMAVGFMFIPYFNLYWIFVAIWGLAKDLDRYISERGIDAPPVRTGRPLTVCITACTFVIPLVNFLTLIVIMPMWLMAMNEIKRASIAIAESV